MKQLFAGVAFGAAAYIFLSMIQVNRPLPIAIFAGAIWAWYGTKETEQ
jgi:hypothetical protein